VGPRVVVVGLGPAGPELITPATGEVLASASRIWLRTARHPAAAGLDAPSFDEVYERADTFAEVYAEIADRLLTEAGSGGEVVYAVPGSPLVLERSVELLRRHAPERGVEVVLHPAVSFLDAVWARLAIDPVEAGVRLIDGHVFATAAAGQVGPLLVAHTHANHVLSEIKIAFDEPPESAVIMQRIGLPDEVVLEVAWEDLDRTVEADHLTSVFLPELAEPVAAEFSRLDELVRTLRDQCPWDRKQTHASLRRHLLEETHEVLEALDARAEVDDFEGDVDLDEHLAEELGDLLYQILFHARIAAERGSFTASDVARGLHDKLVSRHPHVFADGTADDVASVVANWDAIKAEEKQRTSLLDGIPSGLPGLAWVAKLRKRAGSAGVVAFAASDRRSRDRFAAVDWSTLDEDTIGELLFLLVGAAVEADLDAEAAIRVVGQRFEQRFRRMEALAGSSEALANAGAEQIADWWQGAKRQPPPA